MNIKLGFACTMAMAASVLSGAAHADDNLLEAPGFEGLSGLSGYWAPAAGLWGGENVALSTGGSGVTPLSGTQMLRMNHAGGGSASQAHQIVEGPFEAGSVVTFEARFNTPHSGIQVGLILENRSQANAGPITRTGNNFFSLDSDKTTWETFSVTTTLASDANFVAAELVVWHGSIPGPISTLGAFVDDAVLTVNTDAIAQEKCEIALGGTIDSDGFCVVTTTETGPYSEILRAAGRSGRAWTEMGEETTTTVKMYDRSGSGWEDEPFFEESETVRSVQACFNPGGRNMGTKGQCGK